MPIIDCPSCGEKTNTYQRENLTLLVSRLESYKPDELARALLRLAVVTDSDVLAEPEFAKHRVPPRSLVSMAEAKYGKAMVLILKDLAAAGQGIHEASRTLGYTTPLALQNLIRRQPNWKIKWPAETLKRPNIIDQVEREFELPFHEVVQGLASDGYGKDSVAKLLGYSTPSAFRQLLNRNQSRWNIKWPTPGDAIRKIQSEGGHPARIDRAAFVAAIKAGREKAAQQRMNCAA